MINIFKKLKFRKKRKGSATVEAALIFPLIMFIMFGIIYLSIIHYQNNVMIAESIRAMNRAGAYWQYADMDIEGKSIKSVDTDKTPAPFDYSIPHNGIINIEMIKNRNVYRSLTDLVYEAISRLNDNSIGNKKPLVKKYVNSRIAGVKFKQYVKEDANVLDDVNGTGFLFFGDDLNVTIEKSYINPLANLSIAFFGKNNIFEKMTEKRIVVKSVISNQAEFVRNIDSLYDLGTNIYQLIGVK